MPGGHRGGYSLEEVIEKGRAEVTDPLAKAGGFAAALGAGTVSSGDFYESHDDIYPDRSDDGKFVCCR